MNESPTLRLTGCNAYYQDETYAWGPGIHRDYVIHYVLKGCGYYETGGQRYKVNAGESFIIFPGETVRYYPDAVCPWEYTWVNFNGEDAKSLISMTDFSEKPVCPKSEKLKDIYGAFSNDMLQKHVRLRNTGLLQILLAYYIELYPSRLSERTADYLYFAKQYIAANYYRHDFGVAELASAVGLERSYLYRLFMDSEGVSPVQYIINKRMESAFQMLKDGAKQVKLISYSVGYDNPLYFSNCFKKKFGVSPKAYIKKADR